MLWGFYFTDPQTGPQIIHYKATVEIFQNYSVQDSKTILWIYLNNLLP